MDSVHFFFPAAHKEKAALLRGGWQDFRDPAIGGAAEEIPQTADEP